MIRIIILVIVMLIFIIVTLPCLLLCYIVKLFGRKAHRSVSMFFVKIWARLLLICNGAKVSIIGRENILREEAVLFVGNHRSMLDIPLFYGYTPKPVGFVAKDSINKVPIINLWMRCVGCLFIDRSSPRAGLKTIIKGIDMIKEGDSMFIFPEGTRSKTGEMGRFKPGSLKLAEKSGCAVIPTAIIGTENLFEANGHRLKSAKCKIIFGEPVYFLKIDEEMQKGFSEYIQGKVQDLLNENQ